MVGSCKEPRFILFNNQKLPGMVFAIYGIRRSDMKHTILIILIILFITSLGFCGNEAQHDVNMRIGKIAILELAGSAKIAMSITISPVVTTKDKTYKQSSPDAIDTTKRLLYTAVVGKGMSYKIAVTSKGVAPQGTALFVEAVMLTGGAGTLGMPNGEIMVISDSNVMGGDIIRDIGSCVTGRQQENGVRLKYRFKVIDPDVVESNPGTSCTIIYTITDQ